VNAEQALQYLDSFANYEKEASVYPDSFKLDRMRSLAKELGNPQNAYDSVIIAGSKGKGSTAAILSSILRMENLRVGLYTSPHLLDVRERIQVNGLWLNDVRLVENMERIRKALEGYTWRKNPPTYFEVLTALAFAHFRDMKIQVAVLEVGLGGLYDSTNIAPAKLVGLTPVSLEHTDKLGKTLAKIAVQKCGVIKGREIVVSAAQAAEAQSVIEDACRERDAELYRVGKNITINERDFTEDIQRFDVKTPWGAFYDLETHMRGAHQLQNAAQAIGLAKALGKKTRLEVSDEAVRQGVADARWPGRLEKVGERPRVLLDGAHNVDSTRRMLEAVKRHFRFSDLIVVFGSSSDKDVQGMLAEIVQESSCLILTRAEHPRAMETTRIASYLENASKEIFEEPGVRQAMAKAKSLADTDDLILVTGSLYLVGEARKHLFGGGA
jgi:dihydrofolate synthase / folylpolyglutamate synthase